jgi:hypothetical protein
VFENLILGHDVTGSLQQEFEQRQLAGSQPHLVRSTPDPVRGRVQHPLPDVKAHGRATRYPSNG